MQRIQVSLDKDEVTALATMAVKECRTCPDQLRYLLRQEAIRRGLLKVESLTAPADEPRRALSRLDSPAPHSDSLAKGTGANS